jgi:diguanylate cyclase (GGDEF)-like protein
MNEPSQHVVEAVGININRTEDGSPLPGESLQILIHDAEAMSRDALTNAYTREILFKKMEAIHSQGKDFSVLMIDLNRFKVINDEYGHEVGDNTLVELTRRLEHSLRVGHDNAQEEHDETRFADSIIGRIGGDEFAILLPECSSVNIPKVVERILTSINQHNNNMQNKPLPEISLSIAGANISEVNNDENGIEALLSLADDRMYQAKMEFRLNNIKEYVKNELGSEVGQKIDLVKNILMSMDFSEFTRIKNPQLVNLAINEFLKTLANQNIAKASQENDEKQLTKAIQLRTEIPGQLGIRDEVAMKQGFQQELDEMIIKFHKQQGDTPIQNLSPNLRFEKIQEVASSLSEYKMSVDFVAALIKELNNLPPKEV